MLPDARLIVFDKDGVLLDLNQTWMPLVVSLAEHTSPCGPRGVWNAMICSPPSGWK